MPEEQKTSSIEGKHFITLFRTASQKKAGKAAFKLALSTTDEVTKSRSMNTTVTKDGTEKTPGGLENAGSSAVLYSYDNEDIDALERAIDDAERVEFWNVISAITNEEGKAKAQYFLGYITNYSLSGGAEGSVEAQIEYELNAPGSHGWATLTDQQKDVVRLLYVDTVPVTET